jgi:hypothetical protein
MCRVYEVTRAGFYAWRTRERSERERQNAKLADRIKAVHRASRGTYGSPRVYRALRQRGCSAGENRIARVMLSARHQGQSGNHPLHQPHLTALLCKHKE